MPTTITLIYPRLAVTVAAPAAVMPLLRETFRHAITSADVGRVAHAYQASWDGQSARLTRDGEPVGEFSDPTALVFALEEDLEVRLINRMSPWIGLHAGAVAHSGRAIITVGHPDTGKTTTTMQLIELGLEMVSEEVTPVDPVGHLVHPFPHHLTLARHYAEAFAAAYPVSRGTLTLHGPDMARYAPHTTHAGPATPVAFLFPAYHPSHIPGLEEVGPGDVLAELLQYCFPPQGPDEALYDAVIGVIERCRIFRMRTNSIASARAQLRAVISHVVPALPSPA